MFSQFINYFFQYGLPYSYALLALNIFFLKRFYPEIFRSKVSKAMKVTAWLILLYVLLLPLGGYRSYRPNILRYDTTMLVTIFLLIANISAVLFLFKNLKSRKLIIFSLLTFSILMVYWYQNFPIADSKNQQESMLRMLVSSHSDSTVCLPYDSDFFAWSKIETPEQAKYISQMIYEWGITNKPIPFYQK